MDIAHIIIPFSLSWKNIRDNFVYNIYKIYIKIQCDLSPQLGQRFGI